MEADRLVTAVLTHERQLLEGIPEGDRRRLGDARIGQVEHRESGARR